MAPAKTSSIRYAVVGLGYIAQAAVLPAFRHARGNSRLVALVSGDAGKRAALARTYGVPAYDYSEYDSLLEGGTVDAVYIALPNDQHHDFTLRAARRGVHVLCEKPLAVDERECLAMISACKRHGVKLMTAYRLHFERATLSALDLVRRGEIGDPVAFVSSFTMKVASGDNIRANPHARGGGTLYDIGVYCINAARYLFRAEPKEVMAISVNSGAAKLDDIDESTGALLRFEGERVAAFVTSFNAADVAAYRIVGTKGQLHVDPAYEYAEGLAYRMTVNGKTTVKRVGKRDQFAPELLYFSDCILNDRIPEPSGEEGLQDVRIVQALYESAETGKAVSILPFEPSKRPTGRQRIVRPGVQKPTLVKVQSASMLRTP
jgi:glucose-fructose oxidoreductase